MEDLGPTYNGPPEARGNSMDSMLPPAPPVFRSSSDGGNSASSSRNYLEPGVAEKGAEQVALMIRRILARIKGNIRNVSIQLHDAPDSTCALQLNVRFIFLSLLLMLPLASLSHKDCRR